MAVRSSRPPGSAVLRADVAARVVAANGSTIITTGLTHFVTHGANRGANLFAAGSMPSGTNTITA